MAARPIWKGAISFGLVHVPVTLFSLEKRFDLHFKLLDSRTKSTIRYERVNEATGEEVPWDKIVKGFEYSKNNYVILDDEDFKKASVEATQTIEIQNFVDKSAIGDEYFDKPYILVPQKKAEKGYVLLRDILKKSNRVGIAKVVIRTREYLAAMVPREHGLELLLLRFTQELRKLADFDLPAGELSDYKISAKEVELAEQLVDAQTVEWEPESYKDEYRERLLEWIEKKAEAGDMASIEPQDEPEGETSSNVIDLVELLRKSVQASGGEKPKAKKAPAKKAAPAKPKTTKKRTA
jgi:DNA end-binding protein Ku